MLVDFQIIPHATQRYDTVGNWWWTRAEVIAIGLDQLAPEVLHIRVSKMSDPRYELLVFHHELTEALLCREAGVTQEQVDEWDKEYEEGPDTLPCGCDFQDEPGDDPHAPYHHQHRIAMACERLLAETMGVDFEKYNDEVEAL